jgi:hypothetical protein
MTITLTLVLAAVGLKATDLAKYLSVVCVPEKEDRAKAVNGIVTLVVTAILGVIIVFVLKGSTRSSQILVGNTPVSDLSVGATMLFGVGFSAVAGTLYDFKKAVETQDSAKKPKLLPQARDEPLKFLMVPPLLQLLPQHRQMSRHRKLGANAPSVRTKPLRSTM